jgi:glycosyltransferase involved in cell wall biosynthesis
MKPLLSILICSLEYRQPKLDRLLRELYRQITLLDDVTSVEVLFDIDNKEVTTGAKRNRLLDKARGKYVAFIDDDDMIYDTYILSHVVATKYDSDCIASCGHYSINGGAKTLWKLSKDYTDHDSYENGVKVLYRRANHLTAIKREHAIKARFPDLSKAEDKEYSSRVNQYLKTETTIKEPIYHYDYETSNKQY